MNSIIVTGLNRYLDCDPERVGQLKQIDGKVIGIKIKEWSNSILLRANNLRMEELADSDYSPDVEIIISLKILPDYFIGVDRNQLIKKGDIEIVGDAHIASVFHNTLREVEIDWEEMLAKYTGDTVAYQVGLGAKNIRKFCRQLHDNMRLDMRDYLQDNLQVAPTHIEVDEFVQEVDKLRAHVDRLEARVNRLDVRS